MEYHLCLWSIILWLILSGQFTNFFELQPSDDDNAIYTLAPLLRLFKNRTHSNCCWASGCDVDTWASGCDVDIVIAMRCTHCSWASGCDVYLVIFYTIYTLLCSIQPIHSSSIHCCPLPRLANVGRVWSASLEGAWGIGIYRGCVRHRHLWRVREAHIACVRHTLREASASLEGAWVCGCAKRRHL